MRKAYGEVKALTVALSFIGFAATAVVLLTGVLEFVRPWMVMAWQLMFGGICALAVYGEVNERTISPSYAVKSNIQKKKKASKTPVEKPKKAKAPKAKIVARKANKSKKVKMPKDTKETKNEQ
jgi:hypothetical protein